MFIRLQSGSSSTWQNCSIMLNLLLQKWLQTIWTMQSSPENTMKTWIGAHIKISYSLCPHCYMPVSDKCSRETIATKVLSNTRITFTQTAHHCTLSGWLNNNKNRLIRKKKVLYFALTVDFIDFSTKLEWESVTYQRHFKYYPWGIVVTRWQYGCWCMARKLANGNSLLVLKKTSMAVQNKRKDECFDLMHK